MENMKGDVELHCDQVDPIAVLLKSVSAKGVTQINKFVGPLLRLTLNNLGSDIQIAQQGLIMIPQTDAKNNEFVMLVGVGLIACGAEIRDASFLGTVRLVTLGHKATSFGVLVFFMDSIDHAMREQLFLFANG